MGTRKLEEQEHVLVGGGGREKRQCHSSIQVVWPDTKNASSVLLATPPPLQAPASTMIVSEGSYVGLQ